MKKSLLFLLVFILINASARAQSGNSIAVSLGVSGNLSTQNSIGGPGFFAKAELPIVSYLKLTVSAGYFVNYFGNRVYLDEAANPPAGVPEPTGPVNKGPYKFVPISAGLRYYYFKHFYLEGDGGGAFKANVTKSSFVYGGELGVLFPFNVHNAIDLGLGYSSNYKYADYNETVNEVNIKVAYMFQF